MAAPPLTASGDVAAVVVRYRGGDEAAGCVAALDEHGGARLGPVCVVDSGSGDGGAARLAAAFPAVTVIALENNEGFAAAANRGVAATAGDFVLLLNPDAVVAAGAVATLAAYLDAHPRVAGAVPLLVGRDGLPQHRWQLRRLPTPWRLALGLAGAPAGGRAAPAAPLPVAQPAAAAWLVRRAVWQALGGLDPAFAPAWWEDVDFCRRLADAAGGGSFPWPDGFWLVPAARVTHRGGASLDHLARGEFLAIYHANLARYVRRHHRDRAAAITAVHRVSLLARAVGRPGQFRAWRAAAAALASRPS